MWWADYVKARGRTELAAGDVVSVSAAHSHRAPGPKAHYCATVTLTRKDGPPLIGCVAMKPYRPVWPLAARGAECSPPGMRGDLWLHSGSWEFTEDGAWGRS
jgi:hypothetical protein